MLGFLVPHGDDEDEDGRDATLEDPKQHAADCKASKGGAGGVAGEDNPPGHYIEAEIEAKTR